MGNGTEWVPYEMWERKDGKVIKDKFIGIIPDSVTEIFANAGYDYQYLYMPWKRVMKNMGSEGAPCEVALSVSFKPERTSFIYYAYPLYKVNIGYFYSKDVYQQLPKLDDLKDNEACGILGYNYHNYKYGKEIQKLRDLNAALEMLRKKRCKVFLSEIEP